MNCPYCGESLPNAARFCVNCGRPLALDPRVYAAPAPQAPVRREAPRRWPAVLGIFMLIAALLYAAEAVFDFRAFGMVLAHVPLAAASLIIPVLLCLAAGVVFLASTRRVPIVSAIPHMLFAVWSAVFAALTVFLKTETLLPIQNAAWLFGFVFQCFASLFYLLAAAIRPHGKGLAAVHLVFCVLASTLLLLNGVLRASSVASYFNAFAGVIRYAAYAAAGFLIKKPE